MSDKMDKKNTFELNTMVYYYVKDNISKEAAKLISKEMEGKPNKGQLNLSDVYKAYLNTQASNEASSSSSSDSDSDSDSDNDTNMKVTKASTPVYNNNKSDSSSDSSSDSDSDSDSDSGSGSGSNSNKA